MRFEVLDGKIVDTERRFTFDNCPSHIVKSVCNRLNRPLPEVMILISIDTAYSWHGGGGSPFFSFASCRKIHSEEHRDQCINEVDQCLKFHQEQPQDRMDDLKLAMLKITLLVAPVAVELVTLKKLVRYWDRHEQKQTTSN